MRLTKRQFVKSGGSVLAVGAVAGCSSSTGDGEDTSTEDDENTEQTTKEAETADPAFELLRARTEENVIQVGQELTVTAAVENTGNAAGSTTVDFALDVGQTSAETGEIGSGDTEQVVSELDVPLIDAGRYDLNASLNKDSSITVPVDVFNEITEPGYYGSVISDADADLAGGAIRFVAVNRDRESKFPAAALDETEQFRASSAFEDTHILDVMFDKGTYGEFDGVPALISLDIARQVSGDIEILGRYELPEAYQTEIRLVDSNGAPIEGLTVSLRNEIGTGIPATTNSEGYLQATDSTETGFSLPPETESNLVIDARRSSDNQIVEFGTVYGSEDGEEFTFEIENPSQFG